jgi:hypothetical protein
MILLLCAAAVVPPLPHPTSVFTAHTIEYDDTLNGTLIVKQTLYRDNDAKRQYMIADGSLAHGHLEETMRCDFKPFGFALEMHGDEGSQPSTWQCQNDTIKSSSCTFPSFWDFPYDNFTFAGEVDYNKTLKANRWTWWDASEDEHDDQAHLDQHEFLTTLDGSTPLRLGKLTSVLPQHRWHIDFVSFEAAPPPLSAFDPPAGLPACAARKEGLRPWKVHAQTVW